MPKPKSDKSKSEPKPKKPKAERAPKAEANPEKAQMGHNVLNSSAWRALVERLDAIHKSKETANGEYGSQIRDLYEESANSLGKNRKAIKMAYKAHRAAMKAEQAYAEMEASEQEDLDNLIASLTGYTDTPLGRAAIEAASLTK